MLLTPLTNGFVRSAHIPEIHPHSSENSFLITFQVNLRALAEARLIFLNRLRLALMRLEPT